MAMSSSRPSEFSHGRPEGIASTKASNQPIAQVSVTKRLHVSGLTANVTAQDLVKRFASFGKVEGVDGVGVLDANNQPRKFAFVSLNTTPAQLLKCMSLLSGATWKGSVLRIAEAKPDYRARLARERASSATASPSTVAPSTEPTADETRRPKRRRLMKGTQGWEATDMTPISPDNVQGVWGWKRTPANHLIRPLHLRPDRPLPRPKATAAGITTKPKMNLDGSVSAVSTGETRTKSKRPLRVSRRITIDPTRYGATHITGMMLESTTIAVEENVERRGVLQAVNESGAEGADGPSGNRPSKRASQVEHRAVEDGQVDAPNVPASPAASEGEDVPSESEESEAESERAEVIPASAHKADTTKASGPTLPARSPKRPSTFQLSDSDSEDGYDETLAGASALPSELTTAEEKRRGLSVLGSLFGDAFLSRDADDTPVSANVRPILQEKSSEDEDEQGMGEGEERPVGGKASTHDASATKKRRAAALLRGENGTGRETEGDGGGLQALTPSGVGNENGEGQGSSPDSARELEKSLMKEDGPPDHPHASVAEGEGPKSDVVPLTANEGDENDANAKMTSLKDMFKPQAESGHFSLMAGLESEFDLDDEFDFTTAAAAEPDMEREVFEPVSANQGSGEVEESGRPNASSAMTTVSDSTVDPSSLPFFFAIFEDDEDESVPDPAKTSFRNPVDVLARGVETPFWRCETEEEITAKWDERKRDLTQEYKRRHREATKHKRRRMGGAAGPGIGGRKDDGWARGED